MYEEMTCPICGGKIYIQHDKGTCDTCDAEYVEGHIIQTDESIIEAFNSGEWCDTKDICRILGITFAEGLQRFEFGRTARWCPPPQEGQIIDTRFRIKGGQGEWRE